MSNERDRQILNSVVNPLLPLGEGVHDDEGELARVRDDGECERTPQAEESRKFEAEAVRACDEGRMSLSLSLLARAIREAPDRPSPYNNRAQVHRLMGSSDEARADLDEAIRLSGGVGKSACQAYCQRGLLNKRDGRDDEAMADFRRSADLGSGFARSLLVQLNPYAAMCNKMLGSVFQALEAGSDVVENPFKDVKQHHG